MTNEVRTPLIARTESWSDIRRALAAAQKSNRNAPAYSRWVNRPIGRIFAASAYKLGLGPNSISVISAGFTFTAIGLIATVTPSVWLGVLLAVLLIIGYALDSADGQVARLRGGGTVAGEWLDHVFDAFKAVCFHLAVAVTWVRHPEGWPLWSSLVPLVFTVQASVFFFTLILTDLLLREAGVKKQALAINEGRQPIWTSLLGIPVDYGFLCFSLLLFGWFTVWRWLYAVLAVASLLILVVQLVRWYRRVAACSAS